ncbi:MAG TPA: biotin/lipoyl-containing protein [Candidatus Acidoferrales bacterium]|nr:biotin/lipoyl-containing protein [Candidatus Acidoferrales bacterium]
MKLKIELAGRTRTLELSRAGPRLTATLDGQAIEADAVEVGPGIYSLLIAGASFEAQVEPAAAGLTVAIGGSRVPLRVVDPRQWQGRRGASVEAEGRQQILAPMPGKVVRLLAQQGEKVDAGQGILVVEAMKMQNEIRSPKTGTVERLLVTEGQAVNAGEVVAVVM